MRIVYYTPGVTGSGHIVQGISIGNALLRNRVDSEYTILSSSPFAELADRFSMEHREILLEGEKELSRENFSSSFLYKALAELEPEILLVDLSWYMIQRFIEELPCKKVLLSMQVSDAFFNVPLPSGRLTFDPGMYDHVLKTEPFDSSIISEQINPIIIRNKEEILSREEAMAQLQVRGDKPVCLFAFNGTPGEFERTKKMYSYLEEEGYDMIYTTNYRGGLFPAVDYFNAVDLLICGAGYNAFWEAVYFEKETIFVPMRRRFEDQRRRVEECLEYQFEENGADQLVDIIYNL